MWIHNGNSHSQKLFNDKNYIDKDLLITWGKDYYKIFKKQEIIALTE